MNKYFKLGCKNDILYLIKHVTKNFQGDYFYRNSFFIFLGRTLNAFSGFIFWFVATKYYTPADIGICTALISSLALMATYSKLGLDVSIIRFMPSNNKSSIFSTCLIINSSLNIFISAIFLMTVEIISPKMSVIQNYPLMFLGLSLFNSATFLTGITFLAIREGKYYFFQNLLGLIRVPALIPLARLGSLGIFLSYGISIIFSAILAIYFIKKFLDIKLAFDMNFIKSSMNLSLTNYLTSIFNDTGPIISIMILNLLGPEDVAFYFIATTIGVNIFLLLPDAISRSFFVEGCHGLNLRKGGIKSLSAAYITVIPLFILIYFFGTFILNFFGTAYLEAFSLLKVYAFSSLFSVVYMIFMPILNIKLFYKRNLALNAGRFLMALGFSYISIMHFGLIGAGYAWFMVEAITCLLIVYWAKKDKLV